MTKLATQGLSMMHLFNAACGKVVPGWQAEMAAPPGPSTGGGAQPLQHITLTAPNGSRLTVGNVDSARMIASLRSFEVLNSMHQQRYGTQLDLLPAVYQKFLDRASFMLNGAGVTVTIEALAAPSLRPPAVAEPSRGSPWPFLLIALIVAVAVLGVGWLLL